MKIIISLIALLASALVACTDADDMNDANSGSIEIKSIKLSTGVELEYVEQGKPQKTAVLFLHGYTDSWYSFEQVLRLLPEDIYAIALTQRGHGNSSKPANGYHPEDFAGDIAAFIRAKNLGPCIIAGHSMGGIITQQFVFKYPGFAKAMVIIGSGAELADNPGMPEFRDEILKLNEPLDSAFAEAFQKSTTVKPVDSLMMLKWISESMKVPVPVWKEIIKGLMAVDYTAQLNTINIPALVFWGSSDMIFPRDGQDELRKSIRNMKFIEYQGTGHALHWEEPQRFVNDLVPFVRELLQTEKSINR